MNRYDSLREDTGEWYTISLSHEDDAADRVSPGNRDQTGYTIEQQPGLIAPLWRHKWHLLAAAVSAAILVFGLSTLQETLYRAEGTVLLNDPRSSGAIADEIGLVLDPLRYVRNQATIVESPQVAQRAADNLGTGMTAKEVQDATSAVPAVDLDAINVRGTMPTGSEAVNLVNALVAAYEEIVIENVQATADGSITTLEASRTGTAIRIAELDALVAQNPDDSALQARRTAAISQLVAFDTRVELLITNVALYGSGVQLFVAPEEPTTPIQPRPARNAAVAFAIGALGASAWAWRRSNQNQLADNRDTPAEVLDAPLLAVIPEYTLVQASGPIPTITDPTTGANEAYRFALSSLVFALERVKGHSVLITSVAPGDGKTATALNLAITAERDGRQALLVDADERARGLTRLSDLDSQLGVSDLVDPKSIDASTHRWTFDDGTEINFIPAGSGNGSGATRVFHSEGLRTTLAAMLESSDIVIVDSPPVMAASETADVAAAVDAIVVVVAEGASLNELDDAKQRLNMSETPIVGYIFNKATRGSSSRGYGYGYEYGTKT